LLSAAILPAPTRHFAHGLSEEFLLAATVQNLRKLVKLTARSRLAPSTA
jgi:hypothetical protein